MVAEADEPLGGARQRAWPPSSTAARCCARASRTGRQRDPLRLAGPQRGADAGARRAVEDLGRLLGRRRRRARAGSCAACRSSPFRGVNLTRIESRPRKAGLGHYMFFADLEGRDADDAVARGDRGGARPGRGAARARLLSGGVGRLTQRRPALRVRYTAARQTPRMLSDGTTSSTGVRVARRAPATRAGARRARRWAGCSSSTRRTSRSTSARCAAPPCCCSRRRPRCSSTATGRCTPRALTMPRPVVIRLVTYVRVPRDAHRRKITRRAVFARDGWTCQYCGSRSNLTVDHVIPRSKGGASTLGQHRRLLRALQPPQGRPLPRQVGHAACGARRAARTPHVFIHVASPSDPRGLASRTCPSAA